MKYLGCGILLLLLAACGGSAPVYQSTVYTPPATPGGRMCIDQCNKSRDYCRESCDLENRACYNDVQAAAQREYDRYTRQRFASHLSVDMLPSDFEHAEGCNATKKRCYADCLHPYHSCYHECGGTVTVTSSCQFLCFE
jgi:hypothetical protein